MTNEEAILKEFTDTFPFMEGKSRVQRERRLWAEVPEERFREVFDFAVTKMKFVILCTVTGLDEGETLAFIYHLSKENGIVMNIKTAVPKGNPVIKTIMDRFPIAELYEREVMDLLGAKVEGLPEGRRYPLPDDWPADQYPLRKDWKPAMPGLKPEQNTEVK